VKILQKVLGGYFFTHAVGHGSNGSPDTDGSRVRTYDPLTHLSPVMYVRVLIFVTSVIMPKVCSVKRYLNNIRSWKV